MKNGQLVHQGSPEAILKQIQSFVWECDVDRQETARLEGIYIVANLSTVWGQNVRGSYPKCNYVKMQETLSQL